MNGLLTCFAAFYIFRLFNAEVYSNTMKKFFPKRRFHNLQPPAEGISGGYAQFIIDADFVYFLNTTAETFVEPIKQVLVDHPEGIRYLPTQSEVLLETAKNDRYVTIMSQSTFDHLAINKLRLCELKFVPFSRGFFLSFAFPKGSKLTSLVNWALYNEFYFITDFEASWMKVYISNSPNCDRYRTKPRRTKSDPVRLEDFSSALMLYGICFSIFPCGSLLMELLVYHIGSTIFTLSTK